MPTTGALVVVALAVFTGAFLNALVGFGFALVAVPLATLALGPRDAVVLSSIVGLASNSTVLWHSRTQVDRPVAKRVLIGATVGMPVGIVVLATVATKPLQALIAVAVLITVVLLVSGVRVRDPPPAVDLLTGFLQGAFKTSIGISGPPVIVLLAGRGTSKAAFRATSVAVFAITSAVALALFGATGRFDASVLLAAAVSLPAMPLGFLVGDRVHRTLPESRFRGVVLALLVLIALATLWNALSA